MYWTVSLRLVLHLMCRPFSSFVPFYCLFPGFLKYAGVSVLSYTFARVYRYSSGPMILMKDYSERKRGLASQRPLLQMGYRVQSKRTPSAVPVLHESFSHVNKLLFMLSLVLENRKGTTPHRLPLYLYVPCLLSRRRWGGEPQWRLSGVPPLRNSFAEAVVLKGLASGHKGAPSSDFWHVCHHVCCARVLKWALSGPMECVIQARFVCFSLSMRRWIFIDGSSGTVGGRGPRESHLSA